MTTLIPAEELRAAAAKIRKLAADAEPGPWHVHEYLTDHEAGIGTEPGGDDIAGGGYEGGGVQRLTDAHYIAAMHPGVGTALADLLDDQADGDDQGEINPWALAVARAILGSST